MMKTWRKKTVLMGAILGLAVLGTVSGSAKATPTNFLVDGGFELPVVGTAKTPTSGIANYYAPGVATTPPFTSSGSVIDGVWQVSGGSVQLCGPGYFTPAEGVQCLDLDGITPGTMYQVFNTVPGQAYQMTFDLAGSPDGSPAIKTMSINAGGSTSVYQANSSNASDFNLGWMPETFSFVASGSTTQLTLTSLDGGNLGYGPLLDNLVVAPVSPVPEPTGFWFAIIPLMGILCRRLALRAR